jgi:hypothetical protein
VAESILASGFYPQPNEWTCGPYALKHALLALGRIVDVGRIAETARTRWWSGTSEIQLTRAARAFDCDLVHESCEDEKAAQKMLLAQLRDRTPVLLCVEEWSHWITVLRAEAGRFVVVDSTDDLLFSVRTWGQLRPWWRYRDGVTESGRRRVLYDLLAVTPRVRTRVRADLSVRRVQHLRRAENRALAHHWDEYLADLLEICRPASARIPRALSMAELLRRHRELLLGRIVYWHGEVRQDDVQRVLRDLRFVSETYGLVVPASMERRAVTDLAILVSLWASAARGVDPMYGARGSRARGGTTDR